ncbi:MAG TPA: 3-phosphoshikimate 1-carboxyvinyltransferase [Candidatus Kerfeldbacteria bacterium]|nr:3-phosphoshikimate 1-carboxyvinyltransferase [Candidatus Kerfeldbacteria bacterium]
MKPIKYSISVPGSKSLMNRALLCAALASGKSTIHNVVYCDDTNYMISALQHLGVRIKQNKNSVVVYGKKGTLYSSKKIYIGNAGTVRRFLAPYANLRGNQRMSQRPITDLENAVAKLKTNSVIKITGAVSSQFISALLLFAPTLEKKVTIKVTGKLVSAPYVQMTVQVMKQFGIKVIIHGSSFIIYPQTYKPCRYTVEGDVSSATYWWALAAITGSHITVPNIPLDTLQPDAQFKNLLKKMGCVVHNNTVIGPWNHQLKPVNVNMSNYPDAVLSAAVVMVCAQGTSHIGGIDHLAYKETDRLALLRKNLTKLKSPRPVIETGGDHRFAMAFSILGLKVDNKQCVRKSYPTFWQDYTKIQQQAKRQTIVLTGMRGVGKTTYGKKLAKLYHMKFIDTDDHVMFQGDWKKFRLDEHRVIKKIYPATNTVIATGGGTLMYPRNVNLLKKHYIVLMTTPLTLIKQRLLQQTHRPALTKGATVTGELSRVWRQRKKKYYAVADNVYDCR